MRSIIATLAGYQVAVARVELDLPEAGLCNGTGPQSVTVVGASCCGGRAKTRADACCALEEVAKENGASGCGCGTEVELTKVAACC